MIFKPSSSARAQRRKSNSTSSVFLQKRPQQKVLKKRENANSVHGQRKMNLSFIRVFISGAIILSVFITCCYMWLKTIQLIDLNSSFTMAIVRQENAQSQISLISLRGEDHSIQISTLVLAEEVTETENSIQSYLSHIKRAIEVESENTTTLNYLLTARLGFPIDEIVYVPKTVAKESKSTLLPIFQPFKSHDLQSGLSWVQKIQIWKYVFFTDPSHVETHLLLNPFPDGEVNNDDKYRVELLNIVQKYYSDSTLRKSSPTIAIVNNTVENGLAKRLGDIFNSWGFTVVQLGSEQRSTVNEGKTELVVDSALLSSAAFERLQKLMANNLAYKTDTSVLQKYRSQLVLFVDDDFLTLQNSQ